MKIFINETPCDVEGGTVANAVHAHDPDLALRLRDGAAYVTDGVGRPVDAEAPVFAGAIYRVVVSARGTRDESAP